MISSSLNAASRFLIVIVCLLGLSLLAQRASVAQSNDKQASSLQWPAETQTARPWTRWWWHGSAVDEANLTRLLELYEAAGLGGVEITCIYGVQDNEQRNRQYLSDEWVEAIQQTIRAAKRLNMGVDLPAGSGWRMGGPSVTMDDANSRLVLEKEQAAGGSQYKKDFRRATPQVALAVSTDGERIDLTDKIADKSLSWEVPAGDWTVYTLAYRWAGDRVKRPGPGGEGININPFSKPALTHFLDYFGEKLKLLPGIRAQFHDSFEYEGDWQPKFLDEFAAEHDYRLEEYLPALAGDGDEELVARVKCDYRQTLANMVLHNLVEPWVEWSHSFDQLARNQSHGSPANWLDLYAACDIPETESFGRLTGADANQLVLKFAASGGNIVGRKLVSAETATWLDEHFTVTLAKVKKIVDRQILAGVNHILYHGTCYSPDDAEWPGWLFYASSQLNPQNPIWHDFAALNRYVTRCQSVLQASEPDNEVLLYWPIHDAWTHTKGMRMDIRVHNGHDWFFEKPFGDAAKWLQDQGYAFDYVSDLGLSKCHAADGKIVSPGSQWSTVLVPRAKYMPLTTLHKLNELSAAGIKVLFWGDLPESEPGVAGMNSDADWNSTIAKLREATEKSVFTSDELGELLSNIQLRPEQDLLANKIDCLRKRWGENFVYFLSSNADQAFDGWVTLATDAQHVFIMDAVTGAIGKAESRSAEEGTQVRLQLAPEHSLLLLLSSDSHSDVATWRYRMPSGEATPIGGTWKVEFVEGGPSLPESFETDKPTFSTEAPDKSAEKFAGTVRYSTSFDKPATGERFLLDLGDVRESVRVSVNGVQVATLLAPPYVVDIENLQAGKNSLSLEITGVAANRIRDLDRREVKWRIFEDINLVNINYRPFDASDWPIRSIGLAGPVTLTQLEDVAD